MGTGKDSKTAKPVKDTPPTQAYYRAAAAGTPSFLGTTVASPATHPYLWGGQHAMIPPYGPPVPYPSLHPHGGIYPHPSTAQIPTMQQTIAEMERRAEGKDQTAIKKAKGTSGATLVGSSSKAGETGNTTSDSGDDGATESAESGSEDSTDSHDNNLQEEKGITITKKGSFHQMLVEGASAQSAYNHANAAASVPPNLNIGLDFWSASAAAGGGAVKGIPNEPILALPAIAPNPGGRRMASDHRVQDDRELKRQKRKQSNRESARRSRLRKQVECEELQAKVEAITRENKVMKDDITRLSKECERLASENNSLKEDLIKTCGPEAILKLEISNGISHNAEPRSDKKEN